MKYAVTALALLGAAPVWAQDRMDATQCVASWDTVVDAIGLPNVQVQVDVDPAGWCLAQEISLSVQGGTRVRLDSLKWRATEMDRLIDEGLPPRSLEIYGEGLGFVPQTGDDVYDYLLGLQIRETELGFGLSVRWDGVQNAVLVDEAYFAFDDTNRIDVTGRIDGVDLTDEVSFQTSFGTMGLSNLLFKAAFDGWFETYLAVPVGVAILTDTGVPPEDQVDKLQRQSFDFISNFPDAILPAVAGEALADFITQLPNPRGTLQVQVSADPVIGVLRLSPLGFAQTAQERFDILPEVLEGVRVLVTWAPTRE